MAILPGVQGTIFLAERNRLREGSVRASGVPKERNFAVTRPMQDETRSNCDLAVTLGRRERVVHRIRMIMAHDMIRR